MGNVSSSNPAIGVPMMKPLAERKKMYKQGEKAMPAKSKKAFKTVSDLLENIIKDVKDKQKKMSGNGMDSYNQMQREISFARLPDGRPDTKRIMELNRKIKEKFSGNGTANVIRFEEYHRGTRPPPRLLPGFRNIPTPAVGPRPRPPRSIGDGLKKSRKGNSKAKARGKMVSELMKKEGLTLGEASKKLASMNK